MDLTSERVKELFGKDSAKLQRIVKRSIASEDKPHLMMLEQTLLGLFLERGTRSSDVKEGYDPQDIQAWRDPASERIRLFLHYDRGETRIHDAVTHQFISSYRPKNRKLVQSYYKTRDSHPPSTKVN